VMAVHMTVRAMVVFMPRWCGLIAGHSSAMQRTAPGVQPSEHPAGWPRLHLG
jgi:hypothetical protein